MKAILIKGTYLYFSIGQVNKPVVYIGGFNLMNNDRDFTSIGFDANLPETEYSIKRVKSLPDDAGVAYFELNLSQIAKKVPLT